MRVAVVLALLALPLTGCGVGVSGISIPSLEPMEAPSSTPPPSPIPEPTPEATSMPTDTAIPALFTLTSSAFSDGAAIPRRYSCDGDDISPPLAS